ncbi:hypothetical protein [Arenibaculum pallidiluteum]|uniref:hypothetical protein n=1 Tax=Arenibaculum pallidiluteum TaxID=2812559 RepID=UPI001A96C778|nr:hypothetical protein [Arenibaculum pallidiluteum]
MQRAPAKATLALAGALILCTGAGLSERTRAAQRLAQAVNSGEGLAELFSPEILALRDAAAIEAWRLRTLAAFGPFTTVRYGRYLGQGQHLYSAEFETAQLDLYLAVDDQGRIGGLMLCGAGLMPLVRTEDMRRCQGP